MFQRIFLGVRKNGEASVILYSHASGVLSILDKLTVVNVTFIDDKS